MDIGSKGKEELRATLLVSLIDIMKPEVVSLRRRTREEGKTNINNYRYQ